MALTLSSRALSALKNVTKTPNLAIEIEGLSTIIGARVILKAVRIGTDDIEIGDPDINPLAFYIGEGLAIQDQRSILSMTGTSTSIKQTLNIDKGEGSSVSSLTIEIVDDGFATRLITPGELVTDILARKVRVYMAPDDKLIWPDDYGLVFRGIVSDVDAKPGSISLALTSPESKKRSTIYKRVEGKLNGSITNSATTIPLDSTLNIFQKVLGPDGTYDPMFSSYIRIEDEIIKFDAISGNNLTGCVRGQLGTVAAAHSDDETTSTFYRLTGNPIYIALKLMASGFQTYWVTGIEATAVETFESMTIDNAIYFQAENVAQKYGAAIGDFVTTSGSGFGANNFTLRQITDVQVSDEGSYIIVDGAGLTSEVDTALTVSFRSQFDTLPDGLMMGGDEIDVEEHLRMYQLFLSSGEMDFYLKEEINGREFLQSQVYLPAGCYSIPRQARASVAYHIGPLPGEKVFYLDQTNIKEPHRSTLKRSISRNFYNEVIYKYEEDPLEDRFKSGFINIAADSKTQIPAGNKSLIIEARGLRDALSADNLALQASNRRLKRYKFGAETVSLSTLFELGFDVEIGDIVVYDGSFDQLPDIRTGAKNIQPRLFEVQNKTLDLKTGDVKLELVDTNFGLDVRYGLISPASTVVSGASATTFTVGSDQYAKWSKLTEPSITVRNETGSTVSNSVLQSISRMGVVVVAPALSFTPSAGMILELSHYDDADVTDEVKLRYAHMRDSTFADGQIQYSQL